MDKNNMNISIEQLTTILKEVQSTNTISESVKQNNRCAHDACKKKLQLSDPECRCKRRFCINHRMSEMHACSYDYRLEGRKQLEILNPKIVNNKFTPI